ncbi:periplasmic heavy metal sensor [Paraburkholderia phenazinium]|jgi:uncharacterized membrane protein|uniref:Uncharacterized membrane protein n=1 Tax=Paraburkholderia phenazinium TaxID=60549 RepID=A0A1N6F5Z0_9BURK|nr:periplasmic heavy metal sensor [Paraburkholderia phenazinium]SIN90681.1 Uncharacterized membrane protein [Paraburkholderia phenazinium]
MSGRTWKILLAGSFVLNVFLLGAIAGGAYQWFAAHDKIARAPQPRTALRFATDGLSPERQKQFMAALKAARRDGKDDARAGREGRHEVLALLAAPQFDRVALDAALQHTREADIALRTEVESSVADFATTLTPDERVKFAEGLKQAGQWREPPPAPAKGKRAASAEANEAASQEPASQ